MMALALLALATAQVAQPAPPDVAAIEAFVNQAGAETGAPLKIDETRTMGRNADISRRITEQVLAGQKRVTVARQAEYAENGWLLPEVGQVILVKDFDGQPSFIYRVIDVRNLPLRCVTAEHLEGESPHLRDLAKWRSAHLAVWAAHVKDMDEQQIENLPLVWVQFEPIYPASKPFN